MLPVLLGTAGVLGLGWLLFGHHDTTHPNEAPSVPQSVVKAVAAAIRSGDPTVMRAVADTIRKDGYSAQAASLESAADELQSAIDGTPAAKPGRALVPVSKGGINPAPRADSSGARQQAGRLAQLIASMTPDAARQSQKVQAAVRDFQGLEKRRGFYVGNIDGLYGPKSALALANDHGIVPPQPLYWPKKDQAGAKQVYAAQLARFAAADPQRREEWQQAMHV